MIGHANRKGYAYRLVLAAVQGSPDNPMMMSLVDQLGLGPRLFDRNGKPIDSDGLESMVKNKIGMLDLVEFRERIGQIEGQVCRVDIAGIGMGTGFLVGPSAVLTNYHVIKNVIEGVHKASDIKCNFDYKLRPNGNMLYEGAAFPVNQILAYSQYDTTDISLLAQLPDEANLDYALLSVQGKPGESTIGGSYQIGAKRKWVQAPAQLPTYLRGTPVFIVQHPQLQPLKLAMDTEGLIGLNDNKTRVQYTTNTEQGSSGSPCFDQKWELIALHHRGDPNWQTPPASNQGIPILKVVEDIKAKGCEKYLRES